MTKIGSGDKSENGDKAWKYWKTWKCLINWKWWQHYKVVTTCQNVEKLKMMSRFDNGNKFENGDGTWKLWESENGDKMMKNRRWWGNLKIKTKFQNCDFNSQEPRRKRRKNENSRI